MADPLSVAASCLAIGMAGAQLSLALFKYAQAFQTARTEVAEIADQISNLSNTLVLLGNILEASQSFVKLELLQQTQSIIDRFKNVEQQLLELIKTKKLLRFQWFFKAPKAKSLLTKIESIKTALTLVLTIIQLAKEQRTRT